MRAIVVNENKELEWREVADPKPKDGEVIVDIHAAALNRADLMQRAGNYPPPVGWPEWMGLEAAGVISHAPKDSRWQIGDKVCALLGGGGYAEKVAVPEALVLPVPEGLSMVKAAALPEAFATSYLNLCMEGGLKAGDTVLIQAGASGLGMAAIQMVKTMGGKVVTTVGSDKKAEFVRTLGADVVVNRKTEDLGAVLDAHPVDIALDCIAGPDLGQHLSKMARGGRWIVIATLGGDHAELDINDFFRRGLKLIGSTLRSRPLEVKGRVLAELEARFWQRLSAGDIRPVIHASLPITQAEEAHAILENRQNIGKVVLTVTGDTNYSEREQ
ncbi:MAG: NAD(P)H-quinone oxidoreductase [Candidatus Pacebacteria bacterium]|nr:NAD(P)H-quinone oxidoreductase [Candidatus Paceibacterota bacterium]